MSGGWLALVVLYLLVAPGILLLGPLAGLLLVARPVSRQGWAVIFLAILWSGLWMLQLGDLAEQALRTYSVMLIGPGIALMRERPDGRLGTAALAIGFAAALTFTWMVLLGITWGDIEASAARLLSRQFLAQARTVEAMGGEAARAVSQAMFEAAGQARQVAGLLPGAVFLASLAGLALAWRGHYWLAVRPLGGAPAPFSTFTFSDQAVWLVVGALVVLLLPAGVNSDRLDAVAMNLLLVMLCLYAIRGAAIFRASTGRPSAVGVALYSVLTILMFAFVATGLMLLGLADTWLDFRRRLAAPTTGGSQ